MPPRDADDSGRFDGRVALVTGAARGMGRATALRLAREGASVVACDLGERSTSVSSVRYRLATTADLEETGRLVRAAGSTCLTYEVDVRERVGLEQAVAKATATLGRLDILAACAGIQTYATLLELDDAIWEQTLAVNLTGVANSIRAVMRQMIEQRYGRIIVVGSIGGRRGTGTPHYAASKWGVIGLVKSASLELHPLGITVNVVNPGVTATHMVDNEDFRAFMGRPMEGIPAEAVAEGIAYLASESAAYISGAGLDIADGVSATYSA